MSSAARDGKAKATDRLAKKSMPTASLLDHLYARLANRRLFFTGGWGDLASIREVQAQGFDPGPSRDIDITWETESRIDGAVVRHGHFASPDIGLSLPDESRTAYIEWLMPERSSSDTPVCLHLAATGDEGFTRRRKAFALPLAKSGIGSMILENPYYGRRRPAGQHSKMLRCFSDIWTMGVATVQEGRSLSNWLLTQGYARQASCGISMGGHMAAKVGVLSDVPMAVVGCVTPHSAAAVFTEGLLMNYCDWQALNTGPGSPESAYDRMRELLGLTDIRLLPLPAQPKAAFLIGAAKDAYIPAASVQALHHHWPGSTLRWIPSGHVGAFLFYRKHFLNAIREALEVMN